MKKKNINKLIIILAVLFISVFISIPVFAQSNAFTASMGVCFPFGISYGMTPGTHLQFSFGKDFDESVFYGLGLDMIFTGIKWTNSTLDATADSNSFMLPFYAQLRIRFPFDSLPFSVFGNAGIGYSLYFDLVDPLASSTSVTQQTVTYGGFYWFVNFGIGFMLGSRTDGQIILQIAADKLNKAGTIAADYPSVDTLNVFVLSLIFSIRFFRL